MRKMPAGEFKARCLNLMEQVSRTKESILITKRGRPVAKLVAVENDKASLIGRLEGVLQISGDVESPIVPPETWDALR